MNTDLLKISLNQGKQFNNYQTKIKQNNSNVLKIKKKGFFKEGFVTSQDSKNQTLLTNDSQQQLQQLLSLQDQYQKLIQQYNVIQKSISDSSLEVINRNSSNNSYLNKNILFTDGTICYVTSQGIAKPYTNSDIFKNNSGKNGCPNQADIIKLTIPWLTSYVPGSIIPTSPTLIVGQKMTKNESCGNEGKNIYVSTLIDNPSSSYVGCYNDKPALTNINVIPVMNSSNNVNGFGSSSSSIYLNNNDSFGPWNAFDQNPKTFWSSDESTTNKYNTETGIYEGSNYISVLNLGNISGENLGMSLPGVSTTAAQNITVTQYSLSPRVDLFTTRSPNSWYVLGYNNGQWNLVDNRMGEQFLNSSSKVYTCANPAPYSAYLLLVNKVGNDDQTSNRSSVQIAEWNLFSNSLTNSNDTMAMTMDSNLIGNSSFDQCQQYAIDNNYQYFGTTDYQSNGLASCVVSNDISKIQMYGDGTNQITAIPVWETNTAGTNATTCYISSEGTLNVNNSSGTVIWISPNGPQDCINGGLVNPSTIQGSYGGNCVGKPLNIDCGNPDPNQSYGTDGIVGNLNSILQDKASSTTTANWIYNPLTDWSGKDPAYCCSKNVNYSYQCGNGPFKSGEISGGTNINFDCSSEVSNCVFFLILQDDGNLCLYRGNDPSDNKGAIWCTMSNGKQKSKNPDWVSSKGKYGRNYLKNNETLATGEWIGSSDGSMRLEMTSNGNLVLYTSELSAGCLKGNKGKTYGKNNINAVYILNSVGNKNNLGKVAYIDSDSQLREYPDSMISYSNDYQLYQGYDSGGNDITSLQTSTIDDCKNSCNNNSSCGAFVYQSNTSTCWLKNGNALNKQINNGLQLGVRKPMLKGSSTCSNEIIDVDSIQYGNYNKGPNMNLKTDCSTNLKPVSTENMNKYDDIKNKLFSLGQQIVSEMENLYNEDNKIFEKLNMNTEQFNKNLAMYKNINNKLQSNNNIEGMGNMGLNINDLNGMLTDSDIHVLQENYSYIFWSILAVGILTVTINMMKK
jgi:hypothetical protein